MRQQVIKVSCFQPDLAECLPETHQVLLDAHLCIHRAVERITLHGSRGPQGGARAHSDIDLCLAVSEVSLTAAPDCAALLHEVLETTLQNWRSKIEPDLAAVFDQSHCGLRCLERTEFDPDLCPQTVGCMGVFKIQKGFSGFVSGQAVDCRKMYPLLTIWHTPHGR